MSPAVPSPSRRWGAVVVPAVLAVLLAGGLAGCSGGSSASSGGAAGISEQGPGAALKGAGTAAGGAQDGAAPAQGAAGAGSADASGTSGSSASGSGASGSSGAVVAPARVVRTATLRLQVDDVTRSAAQVRAVAVGAGGAVTQEDLSSVVDPGAPDPQPSATPATSATPAVSTAVQPTSTTGTMTVQVPQDRLDAVVDQLARLGTVLQRTTSSQDVTSTYVDTASRVATMQASVARLRTLLAQAKDLGQVVALEDELTKREADLESTQAQLADLQGRTTMSTVSLALSTPATTTAPAPSGSPGFLDGLRGGWHAFVTALVWLLTALGAVLPFLALGAAVALPVVAWRRRRTAGAQASPAPAAAPEAPAAPEEEKAPTVAS